MALDDWFNEVDIVLSGAEAPLRPDRVHHRIPKERDLRLEVRHRRVFDAEFVVLADVGATGVETELLIARRLVPRVTGALVEIDRYLGGSGRSVRTGDGQQALF